MHNDIHQILRKYLTGSISEDEKHKLEAWKQESDDNKQTLEALEKVWRESSEEPELVNTDEMIDEIWARGMEDRRIRTSTTDWNYLLRIAAILLIFITAVWGMMQLNDTPSQNTIARSVVKNNAGQKKLNLPDGSVVWLNGASKIFYFPEFSDTARNVELDGEAFFEVAKDAERPFIVKTGELNTTALGTSFNVNAYDGRESIQVSLLTGAVVVSDGSPAVKLEPGRALVYDKATKNMSERAFDPEEITGWKEGWLVFKNAGYHEAVAKLERWYGIKITTVGAPPGDWKLTTAYKNESLSNILKNIRFGRPFNYELNNEELTIKFLAHE